jgi:hypothetical protein
VETAAVELKAGRSYRFAPVPQSTAVYKPACSVDVPIVRSATSAE